MPISESESYRDLDGTATVPRAVSTQSDAPIWDYAGMAESRGWTLAFSALVIVLFCVPLFLGLGRTDLRGDEAIYSFGAVRIVETGNWLFPEDSPHEGWSFLEKPPLKFWLVAAPISLGLLPNNEFGLRFWDALFGAIAFLYVFGIGRRMAGPVCGAVAVLVMFANRTLLFEHGLRSNNMEGPLFLAYCGGAYHYLRWAAAEKASARSRHIAAVAAYFFLGFMTKFVAIAFLPMVLGTTSLLVRSHRQQLRRDWWRWLLGFLGALALAAPWFVAAHLKFGEQFWHIILAEHVYRRFTAYLDPTHLEPWYFYFNDLYLNLSVSFTKFLAVVGLALVVGRVVRRRWPAGILLLVWGFLPITLLSMTTSKLGHYAYPFYPPIALAAGCVPQWLLANIQPRFVSLMQAYEQRAGASTSRFLQFVRRPVLQWTLLVLAIAMTGLAVATLFVGTVRVSIGDVFLFRTSGVVRPWLIALLLAVLAGKPRHFARIGIPLLVLGLMPRLVYLDVLDRARIEKHPLRSGSDCINRIQSQSPPSAIRGLLCIEPPDRILYHEDYFYLRRVQPFERMDPPADAALYVALYRKDAQRPVLLSQQRYREFQSALRNGTPAVVDAIVKGTGETRSEVIAHGSGIAPYMLGMQRALLVLPGPYDACSAEQVDMLRELARRPK